MAKKKNKTLAKTISKANKTTILLFAMFLIIGIAIGAISFHFITKNDVFAIVGETEITLNVGDSYHEEGAIAVAFGKDISSTIIIDGEVDTTSAGEYVIKYTVNNFRFKGYTLYKLVKVVEVE